MKIYDCFMFFDEEMLLDLRLNIMDKYIDKFVITEASYMHSGKPKKLLFDINKFPKFKDKIIYIVVDTPPPGLLKISNEDSKDVKDFQKIALKFNLTERRLHYMDYYLRADNSENNNCNRSYHIYMRLTLHIFAINICISTMKQTV